MELIKGKWKFNDTLVHPEGLADCFYSDHGITFTSNGETFSGIELSTVSGDEYIMYLLSSDDPNFVVYDGTDGNYGGSVIGWRNEAYKIIDFGESDIPIKPGVYETILANATEVVEKTESYDWFEKLFLNEAKSALNRHSGVGSNTDGKAIIEVSELPTENINESSIYRVPSATYLSHGINGKVEKVSQDVMLCNVVSQLPSTGNPAVVFDETLNPTFIETYYVSDENKVYGYVDEILVQAGASTGATITVGWYPVENLFPLINIPYIGIVYSTTQLAPSTEQLALLIEYGYYAGKNGHFTKLNSSAE